jgi:hypothetical protein
MRSAIVRQAGAIALMLFSAIGASVAAEAPAAAIEATVGNGDKVLLHPNGRWEYANPQKAAEARRIAQQYPENQGCPPGSQGGLFGVGRCIGPGDKDFNRGSLKR